METSSESLSSIISNKDGTHDRLDATVRVATSDNHSVAPVISPPPSERTGEEDHSLENYLEALGTRITAFETELRSRAHALDSREAELAADQRRHAQKMAEEKEMLMAWQANLNRRESELLMGRLQSAP